jgi:hypothetical protein
MTRIQFRVGAGHRALTGFGAHPPSFSVGMGRSVKPELHVRVYCRGEKCVWSFAVHFPVRLYGVILKK